jgi:subtilisin
MEFLSKAASLISYKRESISSKLNNILYWRKKMDKIQFIPEEDLKVVSVPFQSLSQTQNWGLAAAMVSDAWKLTKGEGVKIAILDTGICNHVDLEGQWKEAINCSNDDSWEDKGSGHGTHVAGIIAATDNDFGVVGIAPNCEIIPIKVLDNDGSGSYEAIINGIKKAMELDVDIINMSLGSPTEPPQHLHDLIRQATEKGIIIIAAAGNDSDKVNFPARYDEVIAVAALDKDGKMARFSSRGNQVDSVAPGVDMYSTFLNNEYCKMSGTSQAAPFIAGICALIISLIKKQNEVHQIENYIDMLVALDNVSEFGSYLQTGSIVEGDQINWGFGVPKFCNVDWNKITDKNQ